MKIHENLNEDDGQEHKVDAQEEVADLVLFSFIFVHLVTNPTRVVPTVKTDIYTLGTS
jgi:hypothetical protein